MTFNNIIKTLPSYTLRLPKIFDENKICLKILNKNDRLHNKLKDKYKYFYYYLYKIFGQDVALNIMINYIIDLFINIPQNYYYKLYTNICYKLYENKFMLVKSTFNKFSLYKINKIYKYIDYKPLQKNLRELTYISLSSCNILLTLCKNKTKIEKLHFSKNIVKKTILFEDDIFLNNQEDLINILHNKICLCSNCLNIRKNKKAMELEKNKYKNFYNSQNFWLDPLQHKYM